ICLSNASNKLKSQLRSLFPHSVFSLTNSKKFTKEYQNNNKMPSKSPSRKKFQWRINQKPMGLRLLMLVVLHHTHE
ncbi:MAG: hypothetical protein KAJ19_20950, partial [Gammaproteobacteria bacterium]|nr:hypothetical protein [Gammaproteobacteria bacterium]